MLSQEEQGFNSVARIYSQVNAINEQVRDWVTGE